MQGVPPHRHGKAAAAGHRAPQSDEVADGAKAHVPGGLLRGRRVEAVVPLMAVIHKYMFLADFSVVGGSCSAENL